MTNASNCPFSRNEKLAQRALWFYIRSITSSEQTEAHVMAYAADQGLTPEQANEVVDAMLDAGAVRSTVIDGGEFGFLAGLVR